MPPKCHICGEHHYGNPCNETLVIERSKSFEGLQDTLIKKQKLVDAANSLNIELNLEINSMRSQLVKIEDLEDKINALETQLTASLNDSKKYQAFHTLAKDLITSKQSSEDVRYLLRKILECM